MPWERPQAVRRQRGQQDHKGDAPPPGRGLEMRMIVSGAGRTKWAGCAAQDGPFLAQMSQPSFLTSDSLPIFAASSLSADPHLRRRPVPRGPETKPKPGARRQECGTMSAAGLNRPLGHHPHYHPPRPRLEAHLDKFAPVLRMQGLWKEKMTGRRDRKGIYNVYL